MRWSPIFYPLYTPSRPLRKCGIISNPHILKKPAWHTHNAISQAYARCEQGDATLTEYFTKFKKLSDEMRDLFPFGADSASVWEQLNTLTFIGGMSSRYSSARPILLGQTIIPSLSATYHLLREIFPSDGIDSSPITETSALVANSYKSKSTGQSSVKRGK